VPDDQRLRVRPRLKSEVIGFAFETYSASGGVVLCRWRRRLLPVRCGFLRERSGGESLHRAPLVPPYAPALIKSRSGSRLRDLDLGGDDDWEVERQGGDADGGAGVGSDVGPVELEKEIGDRVDDGGRLGVARFGIDVAADR
jgi:hypothetical protein